MAKKISRRAFLQKAAAMGAGLAAASILPFPVRTSEARVETRVATSGAAPSRSVSGPSVYGWFPARAGDWRANRIDWSALTHITFRAVAIAADGSIRTPLGDPPRAFVETAHAHGVKVTALVWTSTADDGDGYLADTPETAARNLLAFVKKNGLDGVNIDDQPIPRYGSAARASNRELVNRFFGILHDTFKGENPDYHLAYSAPPAMAPADSSGRFRLDVNTIADFVDAIIPTGYTMNPPAIGWTTNPEPLRGGGKAPNTTTHDLATMIAGCAKAMDGRKEKLYLGISLAFGGYEWRCRSDRPLAPILDRGVWKSLPSCEQAAATHGKRWHEAQASPWYVYRDGDTYVQGWYNDPESWQARLDWVKSEGLGGVGVWVLDGMSDPPERWELLKRFRAPS